MTGRNAAARRALARYSDWPSRLLAFIETRRGVPFAWGRHDCALFACDAVRAMTGTDPAAPFRGRYRSALGARRALKDFAGGGITATARKIARAWGCPVVPVLMARRGDLAIVETETPGAHPTPSGGRRVRSLGVVTGETVMVPGLDGLAEVPLAAAKRAWRI